MFLQKPKGGTSPTKEYYDKTIDGITKKISEIGGIEDTIGKMQESLTKHEVKNFKKRSIIK